MLFNLHELFKYYALKKISNNIQQFRDVRRAILDFQMYSHITLTIMLIILEIVQQMSAISSNAKL